MRMKKNTIVKLPRPAPPPPPSEGGSTNRSASRSLKGRSCPPSYTSPLAEELLSTPPATIDDASPRSANDHRLVVTLPLRGRSKGPGLNGNQGDNGTKQSRIPYRPVSHNGPKDSDMHGEGSRRMSQCADRGLHQSKAALQVTRIRGLFEPAAPEQANNRLNRKTSTASTGTKEVFDLEEPSPSSSKIAQESQSSLAPTPSLPGHVSKKSSRSSKNRRRRQLGQQSSSSGLRQHSTLSASSNSRVASRVSKQPSPAGITSLRPNQQVRQRFSIERCVKLVREGHGSINNTSAQRLSIAKDNTDMLLKAALNYAYRYLRSNEPNLPDITLDGLEAIVNDLVHTINDRDPSRGIRILGGRLGGQLLDSTLAKVLEGSTMPCEQDAEFDPVIQLPAWHVT